MNPNINIDAQNSRVGPETESFYTDEFFEKLDGVANALDNLDASELLCDHTCISMICHKLHGAHYQLCHSLVFATSILVGHGDK
jgi:ThiF family